MFDRRKIIIKAAVICLIVVIMIASSYIRQSMLKKEYKISYETAEMNESMIFGEYQITVERASIWDSEDYINNLGPDYIDYANWFDFYHDGIKLNVAVVELEINVLKMQESDNECGLYDFCFMFGNAYTGYDPVLTEDINKSSSKFDMSVGESKTYIVPYTIVENQLSEEQWKNRDKLTYQLVSEIYPVERAINITEMTSYINNYQQAKYDDSLISEASTETEYIDVVNSEGPDQRYDGENKIYAKGKDTMSAGDFEISLKDIYYVYTKDEMKKVMKEEAYDQRVDYYWDCFDDITGEVLESGEQCFVTITYEIKNISDIEKTHNVLMVRLSDNISDGFFEAIYSSKYNENSNDKNKLHIKIKPDEIIENTIIIPVGEYNNYENTVWYFSIDYLGGEKTRFFIEWDMTKDGGM